jgi:hypothetical protein
VAFEKFEGYKKKKQKKTQFYFINELKPWVTHYALTVIRRIHIAI